MQNQYCLADKPAEGIFDPVVKWHWKGVNGNSSYSNVFGPPMVAQVTDDNGDGVIDTRDSPDILFAIATYNWLVALDGKTGQQHWVNQSYALNALGAIALADIDGDGVIEIVSANQNRTLLYAFEHDGTLKWSVPTGPTKTDPRDAIAIADLNGDGSPEIIHGARAFTANGTPLWAGTKDVGGATSYGMLPIVADIDMDGRQEVIAGRTVYNHDGSVRWHRGDIAADGTNAFGNFDVDDLAEIVLVSSGKVYLLNDNGSTLWGPVAIPGGGIGGPPTVADFDGDGQPEIGVAGYSRYTVFETNGTIKWTLPVKDYSSNRTGSSVFDFEGDGRAEVLYADEEYFRVIDGETGQVRYSLPNTSGTTHEYPLVVDIDNDNQAEIIVPSNEGSTRGIRVLESQSGRWVGTRAIWNQHAYHVDNVNEDGTIPQVPERSWLRHNSFRLNAFPDRPARALADLHVGDLQLEQTGLTWRISAVVKNRGVKNAPVSQLLFLRGDSVTELSPLSTLDVPALSVGDSVRLFTSALTKTELPKFIVAKVDTNNTITECAKGNNQAGAAIFQIRVADPLQLSDEQVFLVQVHDVNQAPVFNSLPVLSAQESSPYRYTPSASDGNVGDGLKFELVQGPTGMRIDAETGDLRWTPAPGSAGAHHITLKVSDLAGSVATQAYTLLVTAYAGANREPVINSAPLTEAAVDGVYEYQLNAWDEDGDALVYVFGVSPAGMSVSSSGLIQWTPNLVQLGENAVSVAVGDNKGGVAIQTFTIHVFGASTNHAPVIHASSYSPARVNEAWRLQIVASDADGDPLTYQLAQAPAGMSVSAGGELLWYPPSTAVGEHAISVRVTDGRGGQSGANLVLPVLVAANLGNQPPSVTSSPSAAVNLGASYQYNVTASDGDGDSLSYALAQAPAGMSIHAQTGQINWTPLASQIGSFVVFVRVSDGRGGIATQTFTVHVLDPQAPNQAPRITSTPVSQLKIGNTYQYLVTAHDPDNDPLVFRLLSAPAGMSIVSSTGAISWTPESTQVGIHRLIIQVDDGKGGVAEQRFDLFTTAAASANRRRCR